MMLRVDSVSVRYGRIEAVRDVSLSVARGASVGIVGANGAGKSTFLNAISGLVPVAAGHVHFDGRDVTDDIVPKRVRAGMVQVLEGRGLFSDLSVQDNVLLGTYLRQRRKHAAANKERLALVYDLFPVLRERSNQTASTLSGGEQQMLAIARALLAHPRLLLLDEPTLGLAPAVIETIVESFSALRAQGGLTIVVAEQNAEFALEVVDEIHVMRTGAIVKSAPADEVPDAAGLASDYFGTHANGPHNTTSSEPGGGTR